METVEKLAILADAAKYDASCASSGAPKRNSSSGRGMGSTTGMGICHSYTPDGRCVSLLKILLTNFCLYDCAYCINRRSSDVRRARFTAQEVVSLTLSFYRRNYIEGLFLSSGVIQSADYTMEQLVEVARSLREDHDFRGYIHLKTIAEASSELIDAAGQSTQIIVGADMSNDVSILDTADTLYRSYRLKRVYYSAFSPIAHASVRLPNKAPPLIREHRLYQADWLLRFYGFSTQELASAMPEGNLDLQLDPKTAWALTNRDSFPVDVNRADRDQLLRIPGLGVRVVNRIVSTRRHRRLRFDDLRALGASLKRARHFLIAADYSPAHGQCRSGLLRPQLLQNDTQQALF